MGINELERESVSVSSKNRRPRTRLWVGQRQQGQRRRTEKNLQGGRRERSHRTQETRAFPEAVCVFNALFLFSSTFSVWLRLILKLVLIPEYTVTDC